MNETATPVTLSIDVQADSFKIANAPATPFHWPKKAPAPAQQQPSPPENYVKLVFPAEHMSLEKVSLFNYGLQDVKTALDNTLPQLSSLHQAIRPKDTGYIYVVVLANRGVAGVIRAGFSVKNDRLYYRVNDREIDCGHFPATGLTLQKVTQLAPAYG